MALGFGVLATAGLAVGAWFDLAQFLRTYLAVWLFFFGLTMGSMVVVMIYHTTGGAWGFLIRRPLEAAIGTFPLVAIGFLPIALGAAWLYPWAAPDASSNSLLRGQSVYMNTWFFYGRAIGYFVLWGLLAGGLLLVSRRQDRLQKSGTANTLDGLSGVGLLLYGVSIHFAAVDWVMALQPIFHSTIFGPVIVSGQLVSAHALAIIALCGTCGRPPVAKLVSGKTLNDLGNLLLSFVIVWTYLGWFQYLLSWIANLPYDAVWYAPRLRNGWQWIALTLVVAHFVLPVLLLLFRAVKQRPLYLGAVAGVILASQLLFDVLQVVPPFHVGGWGNYWMFLLAVSAIGGLWLANYLLCLASRSVLPQYDYNETKVVQMRVSDERESVWEEVFSHG
jgi:hypothetical protein